MPDHVEPDVPQWSPVPDAFLGIYYLETRDNLHRTAEFIALEESAGSWAGGSATTPLYLLSLGRVSVVSEMSPALSYAASAYLAYKMPERVSLFSAFWLHLLAVPFF